MLDALAVAARALFYLGALIATGSVLCLWLLSRLPVPEQQRLRIIASAAAFLAMIAAAAGVALESVFLANDWSAAFDWELIGFILDGSKGRSLTVLTIGIILMPLTLLANRAADGAALAGALAIAVSFGMTGHTWAAPGWILNALVIMHVFLLSFWLGVFAPLFQLARRDPAAAGPVAHQFGQLAVWAVAALAAAGLFTLHQLTGGLVSALTTTYGQLFAAKLTVFGLVMGFAAYNRLSLTPALMRGQRGAASHLRRSLLLEGFLILVILLVTASATTLTGPAA